MTSLVRCCICGHSIKRVDAYLCPRCGRFYFSNCMTDSTTVCPDCESS